MGIAQIPNLKDEQPVRSQFSKNCDRIGHAKNARKNLPSASACSQTEADSCWRLSRNGHAAGRYVLSAQHVCSKGTLVL